MKYRKTILLTHVLLLGGLMVQAQTSLRGDWQGTLRLPMGSLRLILHLNQDEQGKWQGATAYGSMRYRWRGIASY